MESWVVWPCGRFAFKRDGAAENFADDAAGGATMGAFEQCVACVAPLFACLKDLLKEWRSLDNAVREQFKRKLVERLEHSRVEFARLSTMANCYRIKLAALGYRMVYRVEDSTVTAEVIAIGKRERGAEYSLARIRTE
jgi:mRNA interferase RelE/StbE